MRPLRLAPSETRRRVALADITWLTFDQGGRRALPTTQPYRCIIRFQDDPNRKFGTWDVEVEFVERPRVGRRSKATLSFISDAAPIRLLRGGSRFELTEGPKVVAQGEVSQS